MFSCCLKAPKWKESFLNLQLDRICEMRVELCFFLFSYICTDFFFFPLAKMKANLTSGMPENLEFCLLELSWCLGIWRKNNQSIIFCFKVMTEVFQHFTWSSCSSCGSVSQLCVSAIGTHVYGSLQCLFAMVLDISGSRAEFSVLLGNVSHLALDQILSICVSILGIVGHDCSSLARYKRQTKWTLQYQLFAVVIVSCYLYC